MNISTKTVEQIEFEEIFSRLESEFKLSQAAVARALMVERGYVSMLLKGRRTPSTRTLADMRALEKRLRSAAPGSEPLKLESDDLPQLYERLAYMKKNDRPNFEVAKRVIESLSPLPSSVADVGATTALKQAAASVLKDAPK